ncbi:endonuclease [Bacteroidia bacterium]|nr:endonuclease [Bacteroidia bacterium]
MKIFLRILSTVAVVGMILLLLSAFSNHFSPVNYPYMAYLGLFFPFILAFNVALLVFWVVARKLTQICSTLIVLAICWGSIHTYFPWSKKNQIVPENCIKVLTYNTMRFGDMTEHTKENPNPILKYVIENDPDIVCFQEYFPDNDLTDAVIKKALSKFPYSYQTQAFIAIFSKFPISAGKEIPIESDGNGAFSVELDIHGKKVTLINNHLESTKLTLDEKSVYYNITRDPDAEKVNIFAHTMYHKLTPAYKLRARQADVISKAIKESKNPYIIVCGDFNDTPISYARRTIKGDLVDSFVESGRGMGISFHQNRFFFRIDYIFHSKNMKAYACRVDNRIPTSDHYPVWTYLQFVD